jgi:hypothetical protein
MYLSDWVYCRSEVERPQLLDDISYVVVKVTTYDFRNVNVLSVDVSDDLGYSYSPIYQVM